MPAFRAFSLRLLIVAGVLLPLLAACGTWRARVHPDFVNTFIDVGRHGDDRAVTAAFDATHRVLAVGRESGRLELWDARETGARHLLEAHPLRTEHIAFGSADGIVLSNSAFDRRTRVWDVRSGQLLHEIAEALGPVAPSPETGVYLVTNTSHLMLYHHARRTLVGEPINLLGVITAIGADPGSGLIAVGTASGSLHLLKLESAHGSLTLSPLREAKPYETGNWIQAVSLRDGGRRLISVARKGGEVAEWDVATLARQRVLPNTLRSVNWAAFSPDAPWLLLAGNMGPDGLLSGGKIELVDLHRGVAWRYKANTSHPRAVLLPETAAGLILQSGSVRRIRYLDP